MNLGKNGFMDATNKSWPSIKRALASTGKYKNLLSVNSPSNGAPEKKDQGDSDKTSKLMTTTTEKVVAVGTGENQANVKAEEFSFKWNEDPNFTDNYHEQMEKDVEKIVQNGQMPADSGISKRKDQNIFNIISRRYFVTGWQKLGLGSK